MTGETVALVGGGRMGEALLTGWLRAGHEVLVVERDPERAAQLRSAHGVSTPEPAVAVARASVVVLATKPYDVVPVLESVRAALAHAPLVVSIAAGVTVATVESALPAGVPVVRSMPNTPALVGEGITAIAGGTAAGDSDLDRAQALLESVGTVVRVPEAQLDAVTALSGSGPAYFFAVVEALVDAGVLLGLPRPLAAELVTRTAAGSAALLAQSGQGAGQLREAVTSPGGTTAAALRELDERGLRPALIAAAEAAAARSRELGA